MVMLLVRRPVLFMSRAISLAPPTVTEDPSEVINRDALRDAKPLKRADHGDVGREVRRPCRRQLRKD